jgi:hypothetical protein
VNYLLHLCHEDNCTVMFLCQVDLTKLLVNIIALINACFQRNFVQLVVVDILLKFDYDS